MSAQPPAPRPVATCRYDYSTDIHPEPTPVDIQYNVHIFDVYVPQFGCGMKTELRGTGNKSAGGKSRVCLLYDENLGHDEHSTTGTEPTLYSNISEDIEATTILKVLTCEKIYLQPHKPWIAFIHDVDWRTFKSSLSRALTLTFCPQ